MDIIIKNLLEVNPLTNLEVFCFEKFFLSETLFFCLLNILPKIKYIGKIEEWFLEDESVSRIKNFIKSNNININIEIVQGL